MGQTFTTSTAAYVPLSLTALTCPTASACVAVGGNTVARIALLTAAPATTVADATPTASAHTDNGAPECRRAATAA